MYAQSAILKILIIKNQRKLIIIKDLNGQNYADIIVKNAAVNGLLLKKQHYL